MKDTAALKRRIVWGVIILISLLCYIYFLTPTMLSEINTLNMENKTIKRDISEIENMGGDTEILESDLEALEKDIDEYKENSSIDVSNSDERIAKIADKKGVKVVEINPESPKLVIKESSTEKELNKQTLTVIVNASYKKGTSFIKALEDSKEGMFILKDYLYQGVVSDTDSEDETRWIINVDVYYYGNK